MAMAMATGGGGDRRRGRLPIPQKKVWRQVIRKDIEVQRAMDDIIPNDIVVEILLRLPAISLVRLRWACKYLFDLITRNPNFAKMHASRHRRSCSTITTTNHDDHDMFHIMSSTSVLSTCYKGVDSNKVFQCYYNETTRVANVSSEVRIALPVYYPPPYRPLFMGSYNGLILLHKDMADGWCIWNPCTKEYRVLPPPLRNTHACSRGEEEEGNMTCYQLGHTNYGFGYDHTNDDYKLIRNTYYKLVGGNDLKLYSDVQVYTLSTNSWRRIGSSPYRLRTEPMPQGVFGNGVVYWVDYWEENIISFDFGTEKFRHVSEIPNLTTGHYWFYVMICMLEGSVCLVKEANGRKKSFEIWVMKDYAVHNNNNESLWTKLSTIPILPMRILLLKYTRNGEILMLKNLRDLIFYDQKNNINPKTLCKFSKKSTHIVNEVYTESLVSTYTGKEQRKKTDNNNKNQKKR